jgi:hypothetical protein
MVKRKDAHMPAKMFIPITVILTEREYVIVNSLMTELGMDDDQLSEAIRKIIREWRESSSPSRDDGITPRERKIHVRRE